MPALTRPADYQVEEQKEFYRRNNEEEEDKRRQLGEASASESSSSEDEKTQLILRKVLEPVTQRVSLSSHKQHLQSRPRETNLWRLVMKWT